MMGDWEKTDQLSLQIKGGTTTFSTQSLITQTTTSNGVNFVLGGTCTTNVASGYSKKVILVSSPHTGSELTLLFQITTSPSSGTMGIRNIQILISGTTLTTPSQCIDVDMPLITNGCDCPAGQRKSGSTCVDCDVSCQSCFDATSSSCYACNSNYYYDDMSCQQCSTGCATCSTGAETDCLTCESGYFMYPSGACKSSCGAPYTSGTAGGIQHCYLPCGTTGDYYYEDGICRSTCDLPFTSSTDANGAKFCNYPCGTTGDYYFPDGVCRSSCDPPFTSTNTYGAEFCNYPCGTIGDYYYSDSACRSTCDSPFTSSTDVYGVNFCNYPCSSSSQYLYPNETCLPTQCSGLFEVQNYFNSTQYNSCECVSPHIIMADGNCTEPIVSIETPETEYAETVKNLANVGNTTGVINSVGLAVAAVALPGDPGGVSAGALTRIIQYSKFLNITYPEKLILMFKAYNPASGVVSFVPKMSNEQKSKFRDESIPYNLAAYGVHSCFVVNFWNFMLFLLILFGVCGSFLILEKLFKELGIWIRKARMILQNFWIVQLYGSSGDIMFFSIIQFKYNRWDSSEATLNFLTAILFLLTMGLVLVFHLRTLLEYQKFRKESSGVPLKTFEKNYECQQIFFGSFVDSTISHQLFLLYFVLRVMLINLIIAVLMEYPMIQTILMVAISLVLVIYLVWKRPFRSKIDLAQNLSYEVVLLTVNIALLSFATLDGADEEKIGTRNSLGEVIIVCSMIFTFLPLVFTVLKMIVLGLQFYKEYAQNQAQKESLALAKGKLEFVRRVEELRMTRRTERLNLTLRKPRENQFIGKNFEDSDLNNSSFMENINTRNIYNHSPNGRGMINTNHHAPSEQFLDSAPTLYPLDHKKDFKNSQKIHHADLESFFDLNNSRFVENSFHDHSMKKQVTRRNKLQFSPEHQPLDLSMSISPLNNNNQSTINYQTTSHYLDTTLDITQNTMEREIDVVPKRVGKGRIQLEMSRQHRRTEGLERHPFHQEIRNLAGDGAITENIKARNNRISQRIKKRLHNSRKISDIC